MFLEKNEDSECGQLVNFAAEKVLNTEINTSGTYLVFAYNASHLTQVQTLNFLQKGT